MANKLDMDRLNEKLASLEEFMKKNEQSKETQAKDFEEMVEKRVHNECEREKSLMKQQKRVILEKQKMQETKITQLKTQLKEAKTALAQFKEKGNPEREDQFQSVLNKFVNSEKNLDQLKLMYHHLATSKESLKKDLAILERKYKRKQEKQKQMDEELKTTREQVSEFKQKFRMLSIYIQKKGGIEVLNKMKDVDSNQLMDNQDIDTASIKHSQYGDGRVSLRGGGGSTVGMNFSKKTLRGGGQ